MTMGKSNWSCRIRRFLGYSGLLLLVLVVLVVLLGVGPSLIPYLFRTGDDLTRAQPVVTFLAEPPVIDGVLDENLRHLPQRHFNLRFRLFTASPRTSFRLGYGAGFLYIFIAAEGGEIVRRDRGYQHGDGLQVVLAAASSATELSNRYYVLGFSPQEDPQKLWARKIIWYHDRETMLTQLGDDALFAAAVSEDIVGYEALVPWHRVRPHHPWLDEQLGLNLCFIKGVGAGRFTMDYLLFDWRVPTERQPRRAMPLQFESPTVSSADQIYARPARSSFKGEPLRIDVASRLTTGDDAEIDLAVDPADSEEVVLRSAIRARGRGELSRETVYVDHALDPGSYVVELEMPSGEVVESDLLVLPDFDVDELATRIEAVVAKLPAGDRATLQFKLERVASAREAGQLDSSLLDQAGELIELVEAAEAGGLELSHRAGVIRRAFRSVQDGSLQPYTLKTPEGYDLDRTYPLIVFLHGSGVTDERAARTSARLFEGVPFIQVFPYARGVSHYYGTSESQTDIREVIEDVFANYPVDPERVVLTGFSMGGYGVYRTHLEQPDLFRALAVFSGSPRAPWPLRFKRNASYPNVSRRRHRGRFTDVPLFVFHGLQDRSLPFEKTETFLAALKSAGACCVELHTEDVGHDNPSDPETIESFQTWLAKAVL